MVSFTLMSAVCSTACSVLGGPLVGQIRVWRHASHESAVTWLPQTGSWSRNREVLVNTSASLWVTVAGTLRRWLDRLTRPRVGIYSGDRWDIWRLALFFMHPRWCGFSQPNVESYCRDIVLTFFSSVELPESVNTILQRVLGFVPRFIDMAA